MVVHTVCSVRGHSPHDIGTDARGVDDALALGGGGNG